MDDSHAEHAEWRLGSRYSEDDVVEVAVATSLGILEEEHLVTELVEVVKAVEVGTGEAEECLGPLITEVVVVQAEELHCGPVDDEVEAQIAPTGNREGSCGAHGIGCGENGPPAADSIFSVSQGSRRREADSARTIVDEEEAEFTHGRRFPTSEGEGNRS